MGISQNRAVQAYRARLSQEGLARFEVVGRDEDRELIRSLARKLAQDDGAAQALRAAVRHGIDGQTPKTGRILAALRTSPLVGADLDIQRSREDGRSVEF